MGHTNSLILAATLICLHGSGAWAQTSATTPQQTSTTAPQEDRLPVNIHGTIRSKYEYQTQENEGRFEVRNARVSVDGKLSPVIGYKAEIDLCDEGKIKMLDAYTRLKPAQGLQLTLGQMRVPFTIDAHRSPHQQYFANRSFIAKQVGNVRDVGFAAGYTIQAGFPIVLEAGLFNGSGLTNQKDFWTNSVNFSAKAQLLLPHGFGLVLSTQKIKPDDVDVMMYDAGLYWHARGWHVEAEYLYKHYAHDAFRPVHAFDSFVSYGHTHGAGPHPLRHASAALRLHERPQRRQTLPGGQGKPGGKPHRQRLSAVEDHGRRDAQSEEALRERHPNQLREVLLPRRRRGPHLGERQTGGRTGDKVLRQNPIFYKNNIFFDFDFLKAKEDY